MQAGNVRFSNADISRKILTLIRRHREDQAKDGKYSCVSIPEASLDRKAPKPIVIYSKRDAAQFQLESAIKLWFSYGDPLSIHALAASANELYHRIGSKSDVPSVIQAWKKSLAKKDFDRASNAQNFSKHANRDLNEQLELPTRYAELLILDSMTSHVKLFQKRTPLMSCFFARFAIENPRLIDHVVAPEGRKHFHEAIRVEKFFERSRMDYLDEVLPELLAGEPGTLP